MASTWQKGREITHGSYPSRWNLKNLKDPTTQTSEILHFKRRGYREMFSYQSIFCVAACSGLA